MSLKTSVSSDGDDDDDGADVVRVFVLGKIFILLKEDNSMKTYVDVFVFYRLNV
jgi:hypothetical protein